MYFKVTHGHIRALPGHLKLPLHNYDRETKSGLSCIHKLNFSGLFVAFKDLASSLVFQAHPGFQTQLLWVLLGYLIWHLLKFLKIESSGTSSQQKRVYQSNKVLHRCSRMDCPLLNCPPTSMFPRPLQDRWSRA